MNNLIKVYDTFSGKYIEIEVDENVAAAYNRTGWNIKDNNESFYKHEIQFSALIGGKNDAYENFREFKSEDDVVETTVLKNISLENLKKCLYKISEKDRKLITLLFFENKTEQECAEIYGTSQQNVNKRKLLILYRLNKLIKFL